MAGRADFAVDLEATLQLRDVPLTHGTVERIAAFGAMRVEMELMGGRVHGLFGQPGGRTHDEGEQDDACKDESGKGGKNADHRVSLTFIRRH